MKTKVYNLIILDESGSMSCIHRQTVDGCNETINTIRAAQKKFNDTQDYFVSIYAFQSEGNRESRYLIKNVSAGEVKSITMEDYEPWGMTPLYDALGHTITALRNQVDKEESAIGSVTIITDGCENSSKHYNLSQISEMIEALKHKGWNFCFIGANIDVDAAAQKLHIDNHLAFEQTDTEVRQMFETERSSRMKYYGKVNHVMNHASSEEREKQLRKASEDYFDNEKD